MTRTNIEARIKEYPDERLVKIRGVLRTKSLEIALGLANSDIIFSQTRVASMVFKLGGRGGFMEEIATTEGVVDVQCAKRGLDRVNRLLKLDEILASEEERRAIYRSIYR